VAVGEPERAECSGQPSEVLRLPGLIEPGEHGPQIGVVLLQASQEPLAVWQQRGELQPLGK
jgi:hypothetical protein